MKARLKLAGELRRGDGVIIAPGDHRVVERVEFHDRPIDSRGTSGVQVRWYGRAGRSLIAVDKDLQTYDPEG